MCVCVCVCVCVSVCVCVRARVCVCVCTRACLYSCVSTKYESMWEYVYVCGFLWFCIVSAQCPTTYSCNSFRSTFLDKCSNNHAHAHDYGKYPRSCKGSLGTWSLKNPCTLQRLYTPRICINSALFTHIHSHPPTYTRTHARVCQCALAIIVELLHNLF